MNQKLDFFPQNGYTKHKKPWKRVFSTFKLHNCAMKLFQSTTNIDNLCPVYLDVWKIYLKRFSVLMHNQPFNVIPSTPHSRYENSIFWNITISQMALLILLCCWSLNGMMRTTFSLNNIAEVLNLQGQNESQMSEKRFQYFRCLQRLIQPGWLVYH